MTTIQILIIAIVFLPAIILRKKIKGSTKETTFYK